MGTIIKWILCYTLLLVSHTGLGWTISAKGRVNGPSIHTTYFLTPNNSTVPVHAYAYFGNFVNGMCAYSATYNLGIENIKTGDTVVIDAFQLKAVAGNNYSCATINYTVKQVAVETFLLEFNGFNYINTFPATSEINLT